MVVVVGAPGTPDYGDAFDRSAQAWQEAAKAGGATVTVVGSEREEEGDDLKQLGEKIGALAKTSSAPLWVVLIGHGTFDGREAKFNLRGADLTATALAGWLEDSGRPVAIINTSASSAPFIKKLSKKGRVVMTATKSGSESSYARFGEYLASSVNSPEADIDQDGATSLLEAFLSASKQVAEFYEKEGRIATEQALIDDNGDGFGTPASWFRGTRAVKVSKDGAGPDGLRVQQWYLVPSEAERNLPDGVRRRRDELETELFALRARKEAMGKQDYFRELERIARALAEIYAETREPDT